MAETLISIGSLTLPGEQITLLPVTSFGWGAPDGTRIDLHTLTVMRPLAELSPPVAGLLMSGEPRSVTLTCTDDAGAVRLTLQLDAARVTGYQVMGGASDPVEQVTFEAPTVTMTSGGSFQEID